MSGPYLETVIFCDAEHTKEPLARPEVVVSDGCVVPGMVTIKF